MPLRPIDAIFVDPKRRLYVVYYRGELWQLPRMKIDNASWQRRQPYEGTEPSLYLSIHQAISDPVLAQKLRTLDLPVAIRGCSLPRFEAWWEANGFEWLKDKLITGQSPLAAHIGIAPTNTANIQTIAKANNISVQPVNPTNIKTTDKSHTSSPPIIAQAEVTDIFASMLADLAEEVLHHSL